MSDSNNQEFVDDFWKSLRSDMTVMVQTDNAAARPMTAQFDGDDRVIYFFTSHDTELAKESASGQSASLVYSAKGHGLFATVSGRLSQSNDRALIERLWNRFVAAWFEGGIDDPKLCLIRFAPDRAVVWRDASSLVAGVQLFLGLGDPKESFKDKVAQVDLK